jgi:FSR family fosmidomycin resistance protein-like MFS transporter
MVAAFSDDRSRFEKTTLSIVAAVSVCHMLNDTMQSLLTSLYPMFRENYSLSFAQIGLLTMTFQITASLLQPMVGIITDRWPLPYSLPVGMVSTFCGLVFLGYAGSFEMLLVAASLIGFGSAVFHPESSRVARLASGGRHGLAQSLFQLGGNAGSAIGPLIAAFFVLQHGQKSVAWLGLLAVIGCGVLSWVGTWYVRHRRQNASRTAPNRSLPISRNRALWALLILVVLTATKNVYLASFSSYFTFYAKERFHLDVRDAQLMLFLFLGSVAVGTVAGGPIGDRLGARFIIWFSMLGVIPFALLMPYANLEWTCVLTVIIGLVLASAFPAIIVFAQELIPGRVGMVAGIFFGFAFGAGGLGAAWLGDFGDAYGITYVYKMCSYLPLLGLLTILLPRLRRN